MKKPFCKLNFRQFSATGLDTFTQLVLIGIYQNASVFATPPIVEAALRTLYDKFVIAYADFDKYGITKKTTYLTAKDELLEALNTLAVYVDSVSMGNVSIIALSGFEPSKETDEPSKPLAKIDNFSVKRSENSGQLLVTIGAILNYGRLSYGCFCVEGQPLENFSMEDGLLKIPAGSPTVFIDYNKSRQKVIKGVTPGKLYFIYVFANNSVSVSPLSDYRQIMAT